MMHSRGTPGHMHGTGLRCYSNLESEVAAELQQAVDAATAAGVRTWNIMLDPGIGFGKGAEDNFRMLGAVNSIRNHLRGALPLIPCFQLKPSIEIKVARATTTSYRPVHPWQAWVKGIVSSVHAVPEARYRH